MEMGRKETKELEAAILGGEMKNAWQVEDRVKQPDTRPVQMRQGGWNSRSSQYRENWNKVFKK
jgi:hypothetical protein